MTITRRRFIAISAATAAVGMSGVYSAAASMQQWQGVALGAHAQIRLAGLDASRAQTLLTEVRKEISRLEDLFSLYRPQSALCRLNADGHLTSPSPDFLALASQISAAHAISKGMFDPTVQPLWQAYAEAGGKPDMDALADARARAGWRRVAVDADRISLPKGGALTLNGIAQGFVTDRIAAYLRSEGLSEALVEVGEISAIGAPAGTEGWPVHIGSTDGPEMRLRDRAIATSAPSGTVFSADGESHLIDPVSGKPAASDWLRTSVVHDSAAMADALSTAAALMTPDTVERMIAAADDVAFIGHHARLGEVRFDA
ncbi:MAG: FAD:protein FMN transferase [Tepidamorphaceae bacterium]|nr:FAD:protein FMN transferase [Rhodobiaceae bacterium]MCC0048032.1 FAD:protein FMN transferase [Rhodobiaceae bacterium]